MCTVWFLAPRSPYLHVCLKVTFEMISVLPLYIFMSKSLPPPNYWNVAKDQWDDVVCNGQFH